MPSVKIGPTKCCMFGVKRKGTASPDRSAGMDPCMPCRILSMPYFVTHSQKLTWEKVAHKHLTSYARDTKAARDAASHAEHMGYECSCSDLRGKLFAHSPEFTRPIHGAYKILNIIVISVDGLY